MAGIGLIVLLSRIPSRLGCGDSGFHAVGEVKLCVDRTPQPSPIPDRPRAQISNQD